MFKAFATAGLMLMSGTAHASLMLDQSNEPVGQTYTTSPINQLRTAQIVTAGVTGVLGRVEIAIRPDKSGLPVSFQGFNIYSAVSGMPTSTIVGTGIFDSIVDGFAGFNTSFLVNAGQQFAFEPIGTGVWAGALGSTYANGNPASRDTYRYNWQTGASDKVFRTFVDQDISIGALSLDQYNTPDRPTYTTTPTNQLRTAQVITAGSSGLLGGVDINVIANREGDPLSFTDMNIYAVENGIPTTTVLGKGTFDTMLDGFARFKTSLLVNEGQQLAFEPIGAAIWGGTLGDTYAGGRPASRDTYRYNWQGGASDKVFRTYVGAVNVAAVPEPATWAMMIAGFGMIGGTMRRRSKPSVRFAC